MFEDNETVANAIRAIVESSCRDLFRAYGVSLLESGDGNRAVDQIVWCGVLGFTGSDLRGSLLLAGTEGPFARSRPAQGELRDWVGELTNQLLGRMKLQLLERGTAIALSTPVVLQGEHVAPLPRNSLIPIALTGTDGVVLVWVEIETRPGFELRKERDASVVTANEDRPLFF